MTSTTPMPNQAITDNLKQIKVEGSQRSQKIGKIFRAAFTESATELKEASTTIRPLVKTLAGQTAQVVKEKGQEVNVNVRKALRETEIHEQDIVNRLIMQVQIILRAVRETLLGHEPIDAQPEAVPQLHKETSIAKDSVVTMDVVAEAQ